MVYVGMRYSGNRKTESAMRWRIEVRQPQALDP